MTSPKTSAGTIVDSAAMRAELLRSIGLPADASDHDVDTLRVAAESVHEKVPADQKQWAAEHLADIVAVQSLLADLVDTDGVEVAAVAADEPDGTADEPDVPAATGRRRWIAWGAAAVVLAAGAAFGVHLISSANAVPGISGTPEATASPNASSSAPALDMAKVGALMQKISANPKDVASYADLAGLYFQAQDYKNASQFATKVVTLDPKNATGWLALGASQFNLGNAKDAETSWLKAASLNPKSAEVHYDLGFLYLSQANPDMAKVKTEWQKVIAIDPTSDIAKNVKTHLDSLASQTPSPAASK